MVDGTLIRFEKKKYLRDDETTRYYDVYYYPVYEYYVYGQQYEVQSSYANKTADESLIGSTRQIIYNPDNCAESYVSGEDIRSAYKIANVLGIIFLIIGIVQLILFFAFGEFF